MPRAPPRAADALCLLSLELLSAAACSAYVLLTVYATWLCLLLSEGVGLSLWQRATLMVTDAGCPQFQGLPEPVAHTLFRQVFSKVIGSAFANMLSHGKRQNQFRGRCRPQQLLQSAHIARGILCVFIVCDQAA